MKNEQKKPTVAKSQSKNWQNKFFDNFLFEMKKAGLKPDEMCKFVWKPFSNKELKITGTDRDLDFSKVQASPDEIKNRLEGLVSSDFNSEEFFKNQKLILVVLPGFTHHTLKFPAFIAQKELLKSPLDVVELSIGPDGKSTVEKFKHKGGGVKLVYAAYPRSNASAGIILEPLFNILEQSKSLRRWVLEEGYKIIFVGYSYGAPLGLELLAAMNSGEYSDNYLLKNTLAFLSINGAIGGAYLADTMLDKSKKFNVHKFISLAKKFHPVGLPLGLKTDQERDDMIGGITSLAHEERQARIKEFIDKVPSNIKYISICAFLPDNDYDKKIWRNLDDWLLHLQSLASKDVSIYNDGQMVLDDCFLPKFPQVAKENRIELGAIRGHHWSVSWLTFNAGKNKFPRFPYYRALARTLVEAGVSN